MHFRLQRKRQEIAVAATFVCSRQTPSARFGAATAESATAAGSFAATGSRRADGRCFWRLALVMRGYRIGDGFPDICCSASRSFGFRLDPALRGLLGRRLRGRCSPIFPRAFGCRGPAPRFDRLLQVRQVAFGLLPRSRAASSAPARRLLCFGSRAPQRLLLEGALLRYEGVGLASLGQRLFELLGRQVKNGDVDSRHRISRRERDIRRQAAPRPPRAARHSSGCEQSTASVRREALSRAHR